MVRLKLGICKCSSVVGRSTFWGVSVCRSVIKKTFSSVRSSVLILGPFYLVFEDLLGKVFGKILKKWEFSWKKLKNSVNRLVGLSFGQNFLKPSVRFGKLLVGSVGFSVRLTSLRGSLKRNSKWRKNLSL